MPTPVIKPGVGALEADETDHLEGLANAFQELEAELGTEGTPDGVLPAAQTPS